jgi:nicotinamide-nucleotide adenylyltransferase
MNNPLPERLFREAGYDVREFELVERERYEATRIRELMQEDGDAWTELVPDPVARNVEEIDGVERLKAVTSTDAANGTEEAMTEPPYKKR